MSIELITKRLDGVVAYLRQLEQDRLDEQADFEDEIAAMRSRIETLEASA